MERQLVITTGKRKAKKQSDAETSGLQQVHQSHSLHFVGAELIVSYNVPNDLKEADFAR